MQFLVAFACGLICLSAVCAAPPTPEQKAKMHEAMDKCVEKTGVDPELLKSVKDGEGADDEKLHCFGACMMQDMGFMDEEGNIMTEKVIEKIPEHMPHDETVAMINLCSEKGDNPCSTAGKVFKCLHENKAHELMMMHE